MQTDGQTDRRIDMMKLIVPFRNTANAPQKTLLLESEQAGGCPTDRKFCFCQQPKCKTYVKESGTGAESQYKPKR